MALYCYQKSVPKIRRRWPIVSSALIIIGIVLLMNVFLPILLYQLKSNNFYQPIISPLSDSTVVLGANFLGTDYTKPTTWFPSAPRLTPSPSKITHYNLSILKLGIEKAVVHIGGEDLSQALIHYPGTAFPGQLGNAVVFGHSVLPQFFNPQNYKTIFSTLPELEKDDEILVEFDGIVYRYQVFRMIEVSPQDISVLGQQYDAEYLTLITCVPPGTYLRRLVVKARLVPYYK
jgi:sortase A